MKTVDGPLSTQENYSDNPVFCAEIHIFHVVLNIYEIRKLDLY